MAFASRAGRCITDADSPQAQAKCDRCGFWYSRPELTAQEEWRGPRLMPYGIFVCRSCRDTPFIFNRPILIPPDPVAVANPRPAQTNTGNSGWSMGAGWSIAGWSQGSNYVAPALPTEYAPPQMSISVDED